MTLTLTIYTAYWTPAEVEFGANDPEKTREETREFDDAGELIEYLTGEGITSPSCYPITYNETRLWYSDVDGYEHPHTGVREERTAHRGPDISDEMWTDIVHRIDALS